MKRILTRILIAISIVLVLGYGAVLVYFSTQEANLIFLTEYGKPPLSVPPDSLKLNIERIVLSSDEFKIVGWQITSNNDSLSSPWLLFFHGNASNISARDYITRYKFFSNLGFNILSVDYRGYGESEGTASEQGLYKDAMVCYSYLVATKNISPERIIIYGHSLGAAVAVDLAAKVNAAALIIEGAFRSIPDMTRQFYPFIPADLLVKNRFESINKIDKITYPKLIIHSPTDNVVPYGEGQTLFEKAVSPKSFYKITGNHDEALIYNIEESNATLKRFFKESNLFQESNKP